MRKILLAVMFASLILPSAARALQPGEKEAAGETLLDWAGRIHLTGTVEVDLGWVETSDPDDEGSGAASDLLISTVELGAEVEFTDWLTGGILLLKEDIGAADETEFEVDEGMITLRKEDFPVYLAVGKRAQPFGVFESHLLNDPMTQDAYETNRPGVTVGAAGPMDLDLSVTAYRGEEMMDHLFESELFDSGIVTRVAGEADDVDSFIISASAAPVEDLVVFAGYLSEPGRGKRNETLNVGASLARGGLRLDAEYMMALGRERYEINGAPAAEEFEESVLSVGAAYEFVLRERKVIGGALFAERKAHIVAEPLEVAVRYERFDDDGLAEAAQGWSVENRISAGARYAFYSDPESGLAAFVGAEYRYTDYDVDPALPNRAGEQNEVLVRLGLSF